MAETLAAMQKLREAGKTRFIGVSNFTVTLLAEAVERHRADLLCDQVEYHPFLSQRPVLEAVCKYGMMLTAYAPVARGRVGNEPVLRRIAETYGKTPAQVALKWLIDQDRVAAVPKAASRAHAEANIDIFDFELTPLDRAAIDALAGSDRLVDIGGWAPEWDEA
jgi:2,5-diketo-D-gluconate reductase B